MPSKIHVTCQTGECTVHVSHMDQVSPDSVDEILSEVFQHLRECTGKLRLFLVDETPGQGLCPSCPVLMHMASKLQQEAQLLDAKLYGTALITELDDNATFFYNLFKTFYQPKRPFHIHSTKQLAEAMFQT